MAKDDGGQPERVDGFVIKPIPSDDVRDGLGVVCVLLLCIYIFAADGGLLRKGEHMSHNIWLLISGVIPSANY